ncbi:bifunctional DNA-formamidopyrimidine glycosylase/DNA-(apurinic or apyrimidinic site) lyase [Aureimonas mangrovi]|uniref:bifunctional DNA-formamidopyrimidine glycosylase/DNA-(apurinic or apyrimidinic site) lyase n=1 Tax=Aureimonas mangrovi TaxID=2758041 RepID=UPI00163D76C2|nr:bifunctional DNA-formamidopyrimidine glycosylase/DNA-(apurinic or apyrimidinic site) lyase [Aureimonas mangrovi]
MPELPEVETVRRGLQPVLEGARIDAIVLKRPDLRFPLPERLPERLAGRRVHALSRRAKYLLAELDDGWTLAMHLGMSGSFRIEAGHVDAGESEQTPGVFHQARGKDPAHDHVTFEVTSVDAIARRIVFNDPRRFGYMLMIETAALGEHPGFRTLGIEPTGNALSGEALAPRLAGRAAPLKAVLLDQTIIAGLGNIYVCEALWRARLSPRRSAGTLVLRDGSASARLEALALHIRETIADAIAAGGSSLRDHRQADGTLGYFQHRFAVYDREGDPCPRVECAGVVRRIVQSGRSTFLCPRCQR